MRKPLAVVLVAWLLSASVLAQSSLLPTLEALRLAYPAGWTHADRGAFLNSVAFKHKDDGWGLLAKPGGNRCPTPQGIDVSCDYLVYRPTMQGFDVLADENRPVWNQADSFLSEPERWVAPVSPGGPTPVPTPTPTPVPGPVYDLDVIRRLMVLEDKDNQILLKLNAEVLPQLARIEARVDEVGTSMKEAFAWIGKFLTGPIGAALITWLVTREKDPVTP